MITKDASLQAAKWQQTSNTLQHWKEKRNNSSTVKVEQLEEQQKAALKMCCIVLGMGWKLQYVAYVRSMFVVVDGHIGVCSHCCCCCLVI